MTFIRDLIDFVLKLTEGVGADAAQATVDSYEVTPQLARSFDQALGKIAGAVSSGRPRRCTSTAASADLTA